MIPPGRPVPHRLGEDPGRRPGTLQPVAESPTLPRASEGPLSRGSAVSALGPLALGVAVAIGLLVLYVGWEYAFGHLGYFTEYSLEGRELVGPRIALTVIAVTSFLIGGRAYARQALVRDIEELAPALQGSGQERAALVGEAKSAAHGAGSWIGSLVAIPIGLLVVTSDDPSVPYLLSDDAWSHDLVWALGCNVLLFAIMGRIAVAAFRTNELFARMEGQLASLDLLRPRELAPFARRGLRTAFLWIGGTSIASIIFVDQGFSWLTGLVLLGTLGLGTFTFLQPMLGLHRRLRATKEAELERVRAAIERARSGLLDGTGATAEALRMPGLLAYEQRVAAAPEWPLDAPQLMRFGLVVAIGLGSWVGGAVIDRVLDALW